MPIQRRFGGFTLPPRGTPIDEHALSTRLRRARRIAKVTHRELADLLGIELMTIRRIEQNYRVTRPKSQELVEMWITRIEPRVEEIL
jgi:DNA-binding XRE family transcriptional regulator